MEIRARRAELFAPPRRAERPARPTEGPRRKGRFADQRQLGKAPAGGPRASTRASLLATRDAVAAEARIRESAILFGCLNHPEIALAQEERLGRAEFHCGDLGEIRDALLSALIAHLNAGADRAPLADLVARGLGRDVLAELGCHGQVRANPHLRAGADPKKAALAVEEELIRQAALTGLRVETEDASHALSNGAGDWVGSRLRNAADATHEAYINPLSGESSDSAPERNDFAAMMASAEASITKRASRKRKS
jgi:DNA primase